MMVQIRMLLVLQLSITLGYLFIVTVLQLGDPVSAFAGCMASLIPGIYFSIKMLKQADSQDAVGWLGYAYRSEIGKWVLAGAIFILLFTADYGWDPLMLFGGYLLVQVSGLFLPLIQKGE